MRITKDMAKSVHQGQRAKVDLVHYCNKCNRVYGIVPAGCFYTTLIRGKCDCSWRCCPETLATDHEDHKAYREATPEESATLTTHCPRCLGKVSADPNCQYCHGTDRVTSSVFQEWRYDPENVFCETKE